MRGFHIFLLLAFPSYTFAADCCEIDLDAPPPECDKFVDPVLKIPIFFQHQFNCSRYWMCNTDLSDCLCECPPMAEGGSLVFDYNLDYEHGGPTCDWPFNIECENKPNYCSRCEAWQACIECSDCPECTETCSDGYMCVCREDKVCQGDNSLACGKCKNHVCEEPECCSDADCQGAKCIDGKCGECQVDSDCQGTGCSTCSTAGSCVDPECCTDNDCASNEYCTAAQICAPGCNEDLDCPNNGQLECSKCQSNSCTDPECCVDVDCNANQYCDTATNICIDGCNEDADCNSMMTCAKCGADNQCTTPECCADSDCGANHLSCSECQVDNKCTDPECCADVDCPSDKPICDNQVCMAGCLDDTGCPMYGGICSDDYTVGGSTCFYCDGNDNSKYGSCEPGCADNDNCPTGQVCTGLHRCKNQGSFVALKTIQIDTSSCVGCSGTNIEGGAVVSLDGKYNGLDCTTAPLDHEDQVDYAGAGGSAVFEEKEPLGECYLVNLQSEVHGGDITWKGEGTLTVSKVSICWSDPVARCSECTVPGPLQKDQTLAMSCTWEK